MTKSRDLDDQALPQDSQPTLFTLFKSLPIWRSFGYYLILTGMFFVTKAFGGWRLVGMALYGTAQY